MSQENTLTEEEMLLERTIEKEELQSPKKESNGEPMAQDPDTQHQQYILKQADRLREDSKDEQNFEAQLQRLKVMKENFNKQNDEIKSLSKVVDDLKSENKSLKEGLSVREDSVDHSSRLETFGRRNSEGKRSHCQEENRRYQIRENKLNTDPNIQKISSKIRRNRQNHRQRYCSPQASSNQFSRNLFTGSSMSPDNIFSQTAFETPLPTPLLSHNQNKQSIITTFVSEIENELEQHNRMMESQKQMHSQTQFQLIQSQEEAALLRHSLKEAERRNHIDKERMEQRLEKEQIQRRILKEELANVDSLLINCADIVLSNEQKIMKELDRMDEIYFQIEQSLKI